VAVDAAGNVQPAPAAYTWTVNADPPQTTIDSKPESRTSSTSAAFTYHANRPDTVFECSMDGREFSSCPRMGAMYTELTDGTHSFTVRAIDSDNEVEASPPSYSFTVGPPPARTCRKGYRRKVVRGAVRCVRIRHHRRHRRHHRH
jgi:large repetitive protein